MNQTIQDFYQQATARNFSRDFQLRITGFQVNGIDQIGEEDLVFLKTATLPGKTIAVQNAPFMGLNFNIPGTVAYDGSNAWAVTFYCTQDFNLRNMLEASMANTFDQETSIGDMAPRPLESYKIQLTLMDDQLNPVRTYELLGCFITNLGPISYNLTGSGAVQEITATIAYQYWATGELGALRGIKEIAFGVESADPDVLVAINKKNSIEKSIKALSVCNEIGVNTRVLMMINTPGETVYTVDKNIEFLEKIPFTCASLSVFKPLPGSAVWDNPEKYGIEILDRYLDKYNIYMWINGQLEENNSEDVFRILSLPSIEVQINNKKRMLDYFYKTKKMNELDNYLKMKNKKTMV